VFVAETEPSDNVLDLGGGLTVGVEPELEGTIDAGDHHELTVVGP